MWHSGGLLDCLIDFAVFRSEGLRSDGLFELFSPNWNPHNSLQVVCFAPKPPKKSTQNTAEKSILTGEKARGKHHIVSWTISPFNGDIFSPMSMSAFQLVTSSRGGCKPAGLHRWINLFRRGSNSHKLQVSRSVYGVSLGELRPLERWPIPVSYKGVSGV